MSVYWNLKRKTNRKYIVIQHPLKIQKNVSLSGIKFCAGYGVTVENSKEYNDLKKIPMFKKCKEFPLSFLKTVGFRLKDIQLIFGNDIYYHYLDAVGLGKDLKPVQKEVDQPFTDVKVAELIEENKAELDLIPDTLEPAVETVDQVLAEEFPELTTDDIVNVHIKNGLCVHVKNDGSVCNNKKSMGSPGGYCFGHIKLDPERLGSEEE